MLFRLETEAIPGKRRYFVAGAAAGLPSLAALGQRVVFRAIVQPILMGR